MHLSRGEINSELSYIFNAVSLLPYEGSFEKSSPRSSSRGNPNNVCAIQYTMHVMYALRETPRETPHMVPN
jgi:hypothetical protein